MNIIAITCIDPLPPSHIHMYGTETAAQNHIGGCIMPGTPGDIILAARD